MMVKKAQEGEWGGGGSGLYSCLVIVSILGWSTLCAAFLISLGEEDDWYMGHKRASHYWEKLNVLCCAWYLSSTLK